MDKTSPLEIEIEFKNLEQTIVKLNQIKTLLLDIKKLSGSVKELA